jgi:hypothetical protein
MCERRNTFDAFVLSSFLSLNITFLNTSYNNTEHFNTHYKISQYLGNGFIIYCQCDTLNIHLLNVDT